MILNWSKVTFCGWIKWNSFTSWCRFFDFQVATQGTDTAIGMAVSGSSLMLFGRTAGGGSLPDATITTLSENQWYHIALTIDGTQAKVYLNGELISSPTIGYLGVKTFYNNYLGKSGWAVDTYFNGYQNDFRIYDEVLTVQEIKEIYKSLVLHFPMCNPFVEPTTNLLPYPRKTGMASNPWDTSLHKDAITVVGFSDGYNGGVESPTIGYHAYWRLIDNVPTIVFPDMNSSVGYTHRWLGVAVGVNASAIGPGITYTISFDCKADVPGKVITSGIYHTTTDAPSSWNFWEGCDGVNAPTSWERRSLTYTSASNFNVNTGATFYIYGLYGNEGTSYVRNLQIEIKNHGTPFTVGSRTGSEYNAAGFGYTGTVNGNITLSTNTIRNLHSYSFNGGRINSEYSSLGLDTLTYACWVYQTARTPERACIILGGTYMTINEAGKLSAYAYGKNPEGYHDASSVIPLNTWIHIAIVWTPTQLLGYVNGELDLSISCTGTFSSGTGQTIGNESNGRIYSGLMSDLRVYTTALSQEDIRKLYSESLVKISSSERLMTRGEVIEE